MKKPKLAKGDPDMRAEYDFTGGERGKLARRFGKRVKVMLDPDVAEVFNDPAVLNQMLRTLAQLVRSDRKRRGRKLPARRAG
jgi:hypothetical protein